MCSIRSRHRVASPGVSRSLCRRKPGPPSQNLAVAGCLARKLRSTPGSAVAPPRRRARHPPAKRLGPEEVDGLFPELSMRSRAHAQSMRAWAISATTRCARVRGNAEQDAFVDAKGISCNSLLEIRLHTRVKRCLRKYDGGRRHAIAHPERVYDDSEAAFPRKALRGARSQESRRCTFLHTRSAHVATQQDATQLLSSRCGACTWVKPSACRETGLPNPGKRLSDNSRSSLQDSTVNAEPVVD